MFRECPARQMIVVVGKGVGQHEICDLCDERKDATKEDGIWVCKECKKKYPKE